jgi:tRNA-(ms[2]io[6]A)-hydroxylase
MDAILLDHAHCEKKAASTALGLIFRYPEHTELIRPLSEIAREELEHFELVLSHLEARSIPFTRQRPSPYAGRLTAIIRDGRDERLLDTLICCAFIEARSCERMMLLADALEDDDLANLYAGLLESEARHHALYVRLAEKIFPSEVVLARLDEVGHHEATALNQVSSVPRMHSEASNVPGTPRGS